MQQENSEIQFQSQTDQNMDSILINDYSKQEQQLDKDCQLKDWDSPMCGSCHIRSVLIGVEIWMFIYFLIFCLGKFTKN